MEEVEVGEVFVCMVVVVDEDAVEEIILQNLIEVILSLLIAYIYTPTKVFLEISFIKSLLPKRLLFKKQGKV